MLEAGADLRTIQVLLGHAKIAKKAVKFSLAEKPASPKKRVISAATRKKMSNAAKARAAAKAA